MAVLGMFTQPPWSHWRVPRRLRSLGHVPYAGIFGVVLGMGLFTEIPSFGYFVLPLWSMAPTTWNEVWPVAVAFGLARLVPILPIYAVEGRPGGGSFLSLRQADKASILGRLEITLMVALAVVLVS